MRESVGARAAVLAWSLFAVFAAPLTAWAQQVDAQRFVPAVGASGGMMVERATVPRHLDYGVGAFLHYADDPLVLVHRETGEVFARPLASALTLDLLGSIGLFDVAEVGVHVPVHLLYRGDTVNVGPGRLQAGGGLGDIRLLPKARLWRHNFESMELVLGAAAAVSLPTGNAQELRSAGNVTAEPKLLIGLLGARAGGSANIGTRLLLPRASDALIGHEVTFGLAGSYALLPSRDLVDVLGEVVGAYDVTESMVPKPGLVGLALEARLGAVFKPRSGLHLYAGGGVGLTPGLGTPDFRILIGVRHGTQRTPGAFLDTDRDGISDSYDLCPKDPEDHDGFEDDDGCPDPEPHGAPESQRDTDNDNVTDEVDECPDVPGPQTTDGCPEKGEVRIEKGQILVFGKLRFETGSAKIHPNSRPLVEEIADKLQAHPELTRIAIVGHTDAVGAERLNQRLSEDRAASVKRALVERGVDAQRLRTEGRGESQPVAPNNTAAGRARNRRVEFIVEESGK